MTKKLLILGTFLFSVFGGTAIAIHQNINVQSKNDHARSALPAETWYELQWFGGCDIDWTNDVDDGFYGQYAYYYDSGNEYTSPMYLHEQYALKAMDAGSTYMWRKRRFDYDIVWSFNGTNKDAGKTLYLAMLPYYSVSGPIAIFTSFKIFYTVVSSNITPTAGNAIWYSGLNDWTSTITPIKSGQTWYLNFQVLQGDPSTFSGLVFMLGNITGPDIYINPIAW